MDRQKISSIRQGLVTVLILVLVSCANAELYFRSEQEDSSVINFVCGYKGNSSAQVYFEVFRDGKRCVHVSNGNCNPSKNEGCFCANEVERHEARFTVNKPQCGQLETVLCKARNGDKDEESLVYSSKPNPPHIIVNDGKPVPLKKPVKLTCNVGNMCTKESVLILPQHNYQIGKLNTSHSKNVVKGEIKYSATVVTSATFHEPGEHEVVCRAVESEITTTTILHVMPAEPDDQPENRNDPPAGLTGKAQKIELECQFTFIGFLSTYLISHQFGS